MSMNFDERAALVQRLTSVSVTSPRLYQLRVIAWIVLGYLIVGSLAALALALSVGAIAALIASKAILLIKVVWIPLAFGWMLARALWVRISPPEGRVLRRDEAPKLFSMLDEIRDKARVPRLKQVLLVADMNAAVVECPRFGGVLGWDRYLILGLPLLLTLSTEELRAVLSHELGHLSGQHSRLGGWTWRVRETWTRVLQSLDGRGGTGLVRRIFIWYADHLMAATLVQARQQELAADAISVELTSREVAARALAWHVVASDLMDKRLWEPLWESVAQQPVPRQLPNDQLLHRRSEILAPPYDELLEKALQRATSIDDTHPALRERLVAMGVPRPTLGAARVSAAEELMTKTIRSLISECDRAWRAYVTPAWKARHEELKATKENLAATEGEITELNDEQLQKRAESLVDLGRDEEALVAYQMLIERKPKEAAVAFGYGSALLRKGDLRGIDHLSIAMSNDWRYVMASCELAYTALREKGLDRDADAWAERYQQQSDIIARAQAEASQLLPSDDLRASTLPREVQNEIVRICREAGWVGSLWLAAKQLTAVTHSVHVVAVRAKTLTMSTQAKTEALVNALEVGQPIYIFIVDNGSLIRRLDKVEGARVI